MDLEKLSNEILEYRSKNNITQKQMALLLNTSNKTIVSIENQKDTVRKITICKIFQKLKKLKKEN